ncbi:MAG: hypothetical protein U0R77_14425 [Mycolicibacterium insubricum]|nr:hypothetical protein [Mycobacterium sp.]
MTYDGHYPWCEYHGEGDDGKHPVDYYGYCHRTIGVGVEIYPADTGKQEHFHVSATARARDSAMRGGHTEPDDKRYDGVELCWDHNGDEVFYRMSTGAARSLAAALIRAADVRDGLAR